MTVKFTLKKNLPANIDANTLSDAHVVGDHYMVVARQVAKDGMVSVAIRLADMTYAEGRIHIKQLIDYGDVATIYQLKK